METLAKRIAVVSLISALAISCDSRNPEGTQDPKESDAEQPLEGIEKLEGQVDYTLADGELLHSEHPDTFWIPERNRRETLRDDDLVKLVFKISDGKRSQTERMWVIIKKVEGARYTGTLDNDPYCTDGIKAGMEVTFEARLVIDIYEEASGGDRESHTEDGSGDQEAGGEKPSL